MTSAGRLLDVGGAGGDDLASALRDALATYRKLPNSERLAESVAGEGRPQPAPPPGGLVLTIYDRPLGRSAKGRYRLPERADLGGRRTGAPAGQRSSLWLTAEEVASLLPEEPRQGESRPVPSRLAKRLWLYGLVPHSLWVVQGTWQPDSVREGDMALAVEEVSADSVRMRLRGHVLLVAEGTHIQGTERRYDARIEGAIVVDRARRKIVRFDAAALGDYTGEWFASYRERWQAATPAAPLAMGFALEVDSAAYDLPPERRRPRSFVHAYVFREHEEYYWDPDRWLGDWEKRRERR
jgi:hypothetical protein